MTALTIIPTPAAATAIVDRAQLARALAAATKIASPRSSIPVLADVALFADETGRLIVRASNLDLEVEVSVETVAIDPRFAVAVSARQLDDLVRRAPASDAVTITAPITPDKLPAGERADITLFATVRAGGVEALTPGHWFAAYPRMADVKEKRVRFAMSGSTFWSALDDVRGAASTEATRHYLNGVFMHRAEAAEDEASLSFVATDGHRLMRRAVEAPDGIEKLPGVILPRPAVDFLHGLMRGRSCPPRIDVAVCPERVEVSFGNVLVISKTVDGTFPDYSRVIPTGPSSFARFKSAALARAIRSIASVAAERGRGVRIAFEENRSGGSPSDPMPASYSTLRSRRFISVAPLPRAVSCIIRIAAANTSASATPSVSPRPASSPRSAASATATTTPSPRR